LLIWGALGGHPLVEHVEHGAAIGELRQIIRTRHCQHTVAFDLKCLDLLLKRCVGFEQSRIGKVELKRLVLEDPLGFLARHLLTRNAPLEKLEIRGSGRRHLNHHEARASVNRTALTEASSWAAVVM
jgi:hypothetical protein